MAYDDYSKKYWYYYLFFKILKMWHQIFALWVIVFKEVSKSTSSHCFGFKTVRISSLYNYTQGLEIICSGKDGRQGEKLVWEALF